MALGPSSRLAIGSLIALLCIAAAWSLCPTPADAAGKVVRRTVQKQGVVDVHHQRWARAGRAFKGGRNRQVKPVLPFTRIPDIQTGSPQLYRRTRVGIKRIRLRVPRRGRYAVVLYLATPGPSLRTRVFDVSAEGEVARRRVTAFHDPLGRRPLHAIFETVVRDRHLNIRFRKRSGKPVVTAVEAKRLGPVGMAPIRRRWADEFDGPEGASPDPSLWTFDTGIGYGHGELQAYTDRPENASLDGDGHLAVTAREEEFEMNGRSADWTSARMKHVDLLRLRRTVIDSSIRFPVGDGLWGNFWFYGVPPPEFPYNGELNVVEYDGAERNRISTFLHFGENIDGGRPKQWWRVYPYASPLTEFTRYTLATVPGAIELRVNGRRQTSWSSADMSPQGRWPLNHKFELIFSLAVGGDFVNGPPSDATDFPALMELDYVRVSR
jgi:hypothetical protein